MLGTPALYKPAPCCMFNDFFVYVVNGKLDSGMADGECRMSFKVDNLAAALPTLYYYQSPSLSSPNPNTPKSQFPLVQLFMFFL